MDSGREDPANERNNKLKSLTQYTTLKDLGLRLYDLGFNVIPVGLDKKPLCSWSPDKRIERRNLEKLLDKATGIAIVGGHENPWKYVGARLIIIDIDNPSILDSVPTLREVMNKTVSWRTGIRCPKCMNKHIDVLEFGRKFKCAMCDIEFSIEKAPRGLGALIIVDKDTAERYFNKTRSFGYIEFLINNYQLIPPSLHKTGARYEWVKQLNFNDVTLGIYSAASHEVEAVLKELKEVLKEEKQKKVRVEEEGEIQRRKPIKPLRIIELSDKEVEQLLELLKPYYVPGFRHNIWYAFSGLCAKRGISLASCLKVLVKLFKHDQDPKKEFKDLYVVVRSYRKLGIDVKPYTEEMLDVIRQELGEEFARREYLEDLVQREFVQEEPAATSSLYRDVLLPILRDEAKAKEVLREIKKVIGKARRRALGLLRVCYPIDKERSLYVVADLEKLEVYVAKLEIATSSEKPRIRVKVKEPVAEGAPTHVVVYENPITGSTKFTVQWEASTRSRPLVIGPATKSEIISRLGTEGLVLNKRRVDDAISTILEAFIKKGIAERKEVVDAPGFYLIKSEGSERIIVVNYDVEEHSKEELRKALLLLNELVETWFLRVKSKFVTVIKWWVVAPFSYIVKQQGSFIPWLYQYGPPNTGKSTANLVGANIWGFRYSLMGNDYEIPGSSIDTPATLGRWLEAGTFPIAVREPKTVFEKDELVEMMKSAVEGLYSRGRHRGGRYELYNAFASMSFTSNSYIPRKQGLIDKRLYVISYSYTEAFKPEKLEDNEKINRFEVEVKPRLCILKALGRFIAKRVIENPALLKGVSWIGHTWFEFSEKMLEDAFKAVGIEPPEWIRLRHKTATIGDVYEDLRESIRVALLEEIEDAYVKHVGRVAVEANNELRIYDRGELSRRQRIDMVIEKGYIPWLLHRHSNDEVVISTAVLGTLRKKGIEVDDLKSLAELLEWEYRKDVKVGGKNRAGVLVPRKRFIEFLAPEDVEVENEKR